MERPSPLVIVRAVRTLISVASFAFLFACGSEEEGLNPAPDSGTNTPNDSGTPPADSGVVGADAGFVDATPNDTGVVVDPPGELTLPAITTGANGDSPEVNFELPAGVVSFMIVLEGPDDVTMIVKRLSGPGGVLVTDDDSALTQLERLFLGPWGAQFKSPNRVVQDIGISSSLFPNNPGVNVSGGGYTMVASAVRIQGQNGNPYQGTLTGKVLYRMAQASAGRLDLHLYFSGAGNLTAAAAPTDPLVQGALQKLSSVYAQANLTVGTVDYHDVDASFRTISGIDGSSDQLERMFRLTEGRGAGLHYFFVDRFEGGLPGGMVAGISGGLPGPPLRPGTNNSGVAVALAAINGDPEILGHVMAHEGGHWLGLFHTAEFIGTQDQLSDTPSDQTAGQNYLMYPAVGGGTMVSPSQSTVIRHHLEVVGG